MNLDLMKRINPHFANPVLESLGMNILKQTLKWFENGHSDKGPKNRLRKSVNLVVLRKQLTNSDGDLRKVKEFQMVINVETASLSEDGENKLNFYLLNFYLMRKMEYFIKFAL